MSTTTKERISNISKGETNIEFTCFHLLSLKANQVKDVILEKKNGLV